MSRKPPSKQSGPTPPAPLSALGVRLLLEMAKDPARTEYSARLLGGAFEDTEIALLHAAYAELLARGLVDPTGTVVSFFGAPKSLVRINESGLKQVRERAA